MHASKWDKNHAQALDHVGYNCFQKSDMPNASAAFDLSHIHGIDSCQAASLIEMADDAWAGYRPEISSHPSIPCKIGTK